MTLSVLPGPPRPAPDPHWSAVDVGHWCRAALADSGVRLRDSGGLALVVADPETVADAPPGSVVVVDWPPDTACPDLTHLAGVGTLSREGAVALGSGGIPTTVLPLPRETPPTPVPTAGPMGLHFSGWQWDSQRDTRPGIRVTPDERLLTLIADAEDSDHRWSDVFYAYAEACADQPGNTLLIWMSHRDPDVVRPVVEDIASRPPDFRCRVIMAAGTMTPTAYAGLLHRTDVFIAPQDPVSGRRPTALFADSGALVIGDAATYPEITATRPWLTVPTHSEVVASHLEVEPRLTRTRRLYDWDRLVEAIHVATTEELPARDVADLPDGRPVDRVMDFLRASLSRAYEPR